MTFWNICFTKLKFFIFINSSKIGVLFFSMYLMLFGYIFISVYTFIVDLLWHKLSDSLVFIIGEKYLIYFDSGKINAYRVYLTPLEVQKALEKYNLSFVQLLAQSCKSFTLTEQDFYLAKITHITIPTHDVNCHLPREIYSHHGGIVKAITKDICSRAKS